MTVTYSKLVANGSSFGCFWRILYKWRGSVYKLVWRELLVFLCLYFSINLLYRHGLNEAQQRQFERLRAYFGSHGETIPMSFVLGFYVSLVVKRWWEQYRLLPWPDTLALFVSAAIPGVDERGRLMRRNIVRYAVLAYVITLNHVSVRVKKRFPGWQHMVDAGFMMECEKKIFELMDGKSPMSKYWMPLVWATNIINRARKEGLIQSDHVVQTMLQELSDIRRRLGSLIGYDTVCVPLVYTQVVTLSVYTYFMAQLMGRQFVETRHPDGTVTGDPDIFFPLFTSLQFCFYIGWLKVAEVLINPFGEDDDDIELNWLIDRHIKAAYMIVDEMHEEHPELLKDQYWDEVVPKDLPYTVASECYRRAEPKGSAEDYKVKDSDALYANLMPQRNKPGPEDVYADYESVDTPLVERRKNWFQRQLQRMGSVRSSSTTYSSAGMAFNSRPRHNSVYSQISFVQGENGGLPGPVPGPVSAQILSQTTLPIHQQQQQQPPPERQPKMSIYDRFVNRRSSRGQNKRSSVQKNRPRIPTPDVTIIRNNDANGSAPSTPGTPNMLTPQPYPTDVPVVQVLLTPIQEAEGGVVAVGGMGMGSPGHHQHHQLTMAGVGAKALAQAVLSPGMGPIGPVTLAATPVTFSQPILFTASPGPHRPVRSSAPPRSAVTLTEVSSHSGSASGSEEEGSSASPRPTTPATPTSTPSVTPTPAAAAAFAAAVTPAVSNATSTPATSPPRSTANSLAPSAAPSAASTVERKKGTAERRTGAPNKREVYV
ncbi:bestrophin-2 isoform X6 [Frankliniella occidentalis]|uniref:Bestrophin-2 isoform X6 n=1 Tax=Frankliniella occidentalis TaxID=133901 RepID=A0A9C6U6T0_FRAOC|nr:bestrophin-2 isoform X6 [Frankliniella occidentalis]